MTITTPSTDFNYGGTTEFCVGATNPVATITGPTGVFSATGGLVIDSLTVKSVIHSNSRKLSGNLYAFK